MPVDANELIVGVDFAGPRRAVDQRRKIIAIGAARIAPSVYHVMPDGFNDRLTQGSDLPGWTGEELARALRGGHLARVVAFDFPFSIPQRLLDDPGFTAAVGLDQPFEAWASFNQFVATALPLGCPIDLSPFAGWRNKAYWLKRATDVPARAQPPLKDRFQVLFNMTLLGNALLAALATDDAYRIIPFQDPGLPPEVIEVYPGVAMRNLGRPDYKRDPARAIDAILDHCAVQGVRFDVAPAIRSFCETYNTAGRGSFDPDGSDALIALAVAVLYREGQCQAVGRTGQQEQLRGEGVIWAPTI